MIVFDEILPVIAAILREHPGLAPFVINRDLSGRVRLIFSEKSQEDGNIGILAEKMSERLVPHGFPADKMVIFEPSLESVKENVPCFPLEGFENTAVVDRLALEADWSDMRPLSEGAPRIVFFSIKGGVGRSTAAAAAAWALAQKRQRVMILDMDLESPGLSTYLLPEERRPKHGIADWLVEDLVDNGDSLLDDMFALSELSHDGAIYVVPAHGKDPGEYVSKLGRVWMPKVCREGVRMSWTCRLERLLTQLETRLRPDVIFIDSRAGIDEISSACVTGLGAKKILLFASNSEQTWTGYNILFKYWLRTGVAAEIRDRLQMVGAMLPATDNVKYFNGLCERAWNLFRDSLYDEVPAGEVGENAFSYDKDEESAPHFPWKIRWNQEFSSLRSIHDRMMEIDGDEIDSIFGSLIGGVLSVIDTVKPLENKRGDAHE
ncbi:MAG: P-loop NTPase [Synergistaceae bacterium]|jgi:hypothetical protein|nr:P-loop NTPase [Synergistaceae bacterium]